MTFASPPLPHPSSVSHLAVCTVRKILHSFMVSITVSGLLVEVGLGLRAIPLIGNTSVCNNLVLRSSCRHPKSACYGLFVGCKKQDHKLALHSPTSSAFLFHPHALYWPTAPQLVFCYHADCLAIRSPPCHSLAGIPLPHPLPHPIMVHTVVTLCHSIALPSWRMSNALARGNSHVTIDLWFFLVPAYTSAKRWSASDTIVLCPDSDSASCVSCASCTCAPHPVASGASRDPCLHWVLSRYMQLSNPASHAS